MSRLGRIRRFAATAATSVIVWLCVGVASSAGEDVPVEEDYLLQCVACHGMDGGGTPGVTPGLRNLESVLRAKGGREYLGRVPGVAQAPLSDERLARLLNWVLQRYSGVTPEPPYGAAEVRSLRERPLRDPLGARAALFEQ